MESLEFFNPNLGKKNGWEMCFGIPKGNCFISVSRTLAFWMTRLRYDRRSQSKRLKINKSLPVLDLGVWSHFHHRINFHPILSFPACRCSLRKAQNYHGALAKTGEFLEHFCIMLLQGLAEALQKPMRLIRVAAGRVGRRLYPLDPSIAELQAMRDMKARLVVKRTCEQLQLQAGGVPV